MRKSLRLKMRDLMRRMTIAKTRKKKTKKDKATSQCPTSPQSRVKKEVWSKSL